MPTDPRAAVEAAARDLLRTLAQLEVPRPVRVSEVGEGVPLACLIQVWDPQRLMPTARDERRTRDPGRRARCKQDIIDLLGSVGRPLTRKEVVRALKDAERGHGEGTIAKALADLTSSEQLVNTRDGRGYRLADWARRRTTPSLF
jgi:hypothetical protein